MLSFRSLTALLVGLLFSEAADARDDIVAPSTLTPQNIRSETVRRTPDAGLPPQLAPSRSEFPSNLDVLVADVTVEGAFPEFAAVNDAIARSLIGRRATISEIYDAAKAIEAVYAQAGYIFVRVVVPPQKLVDRGRLKLLVVDGFIESLDLAGVPELVRAAVADRVMPLVGLRRVRREAVERRLLLAGELPGLTLKSTLARGVNNDGGVKLVLEGEHRPISGSFGGDDRNRSSLGTWQLRGAVVANGLSGYGEQIYATAGASTAFQSLFDGNAPLALYGGGVVIPIGVDGLSINPEYTSSKTWTPAGVGVPATTGKFDRVALRLRSVVKRTQKETLIGSVAVEYISQDVKAPDFNATISSDRYAVARGGAEYEVVLSNAAALRGGISVSQGLGGRTESDAIASSIPLSHTGATPDFTKANITARYTYPLIKGALLDVFGSGQWSLNKPLFRSEQLSLDGSEGVSAFSAGTLNSDTGVVLRSEISRPFDVIFGMRPDPAPGFISPYVFAASGRGWFYNATPAEQSVITSSALGVGVRGGVSPSARSPGFTFGLELARQFTDLINERQGWRANVIASVAF
jgi:hemolysin activation/secretion protein